MERLKLGNKGPYLVLMAISMVFAATSCTQNTGKNLLQDKLVQKAYESVFVTSSGDEVAVALVEFEAEHPQHFQSKVDLAQLYFAEGEYVLSYQYLQRALALVEDATGIPSGVEGASLELMYRLLAYLCLYRGDLIHAESYGRQALSYAEQVAEGEDRDEYRAPALFLMGQVLYASGENEDFSQSEKLQEALSSFDKAYSLNPTLISSTHLLGYGKLLVQNHRGAEAERLVEDYFALGNLNLDTLTIAKLIYEVSGNQEKATICDFLAYEYLVGGISEEAAMAKELVNGAVSEKKWLTEYEALVESFAEAGNLVESEDFFGRSFCEVASKMEKGHGTKSDMETLLEIEGYFVNFPSYYWLLWQLAIEVLEQDTIETFIPVLKKCISLNPSGIYATQARQEIKNLLGNGNFAQSTIKDSLLNSILF